MLEQQFISHINEEKLFGRGDRLIVAVSGGLDSVVLCHLCHRANLDFEMAHVNFRLRGEESDGDEFFVRSLAADLRVPLHVTSFDTNAISRERRKSTQETARDLRYDWFDSLLEDGRGFILTAHHADDNIETQMMHFFRGTGIHGLRGIPLKTRNRVRPLLPFTRNEIFSYASARNLAWREDSSNSSEKYTRNFFRNTIIPLIEKVYPGVEQNILENTQRFYEAELLYMQAVELHRKQLMVKRGSEWHLPVLKVKKAIPVRTILFELLHPFKFVAAQLDDVVRLLDGEHGKMVLSDTHRIIRNRNWLIVAPRYDSESQPVYIDGPGETSFASGTLIVRESVSGEIKIDKDPQTAMLDSALIQYPLILRRWKEGDYFYPLGMKKKKKISRFLIDLKLSRTEKERIMILESNKRICWVIGKRIDDRFRVTESTRKAIEINFESGGKGG